MYIKYVNFFEKFFFKKKSLKMKNTIIIFNENSHKVFSIKLDADIVKKLQVLQQDIREVVGYFNTDIHDNLIEIIGIDTVAHGDDDQVAYRELRPYVFHTHPSGNQPEPPSGEDFMQALTWGFPDFNREKKHSTLELVVSHEGFWWYFASERLLALYYDLQDNDQEEQNRVSKKMLRYLTAVTTLFKNGLISAEKLIDLVNTLQFYWLAEVLRNNDGVLQYLCSEFPLESMNKLSIVDCTEMPGFFLKLTNE
jgi:hypothetical protein